MFKEHFFVVFAGTDGSSLQNNKITKFSVFVRGGGGNGYSGRVLNLSFERSRGGSRLPKLSRCEQGGVTSNFRPFVIR